MMNVEIAGRMRNERKSEDGRQHVADEGQAEAAPHPAMHDLLQFPLCFQIQVDGAVHYRKKHRQQSDQYRIWPDKTEKRAGEFAPGIDRYAEDRIPRRHSK